MQLFSLIVNNYTGGKMGGTVECVIRGKHHRQPQLIDSGRVACLGTFTSIVLLSMIRLVELDEWKMMTMTPSVFTHNEKRFLLRGAFCLGIGSGRSDSPFTLLLIHHAKR